MRKGQKHSEESKLKMGLVWKGRHHSEETKRKMSESRKGYVPSLETRQKWSFIRKGKKRGKYNLSDESRKRRSEAAKRQKGRIASFETRQKLSQAAKGRINSEEHNQNISKALMGHYVSTETRQKMSEQLIQAHKDGKYINVNNGAKNFYKHGKFYSKKNNKEFFYRSSWELQAYQIFEQMTKVIAYEAEPFSIEYIGEDKKSHSYHPDILVTYDDYSQELIEIKPKTDLNKIKNILKFEAGKKYAQKNNMQFTIMTKESLDKLEVA